MISLRLALCSLLLLWGAPAGRARANDAPTACGATDLCTDNAAEQLRIRFEAGAVRVAGSPVHGARLELVGFGRGDKIRPAPTRGRRVEGRRVTYERGGLNEWFESGPHGLQQGFDVPHRPAGGGALELVLAVDGLTPRLLDADRVVLARGGEAQLEYRTLRAWDARGKPLPARLSVRAGTIVLGVDDRAARYPIVIDPYVQQAKLAPAGLKKNFDFGTALAVSADTLLVGTPGDDQYFVASGAVHVYTRQGDAWAPEARLVAAQPSDRAMFGSAVAIAGTTLAIAARQELTGLDRIGAAYVFERDGSGFTQVARLAPSDGVARDQFGTSVAVGTDLVAVGSMFADVGNLDSAGAVYIFARREGGWTEVQKITVPSPQASGLFGRELAISGDTLIVGCDGEVINGLRAGAAYVYRWNGAQYVLEARLTPPVPNSLQDFGFAVALQGDRAAIGAFGDGETNAVYGAVYVFERTGTTWRQTARLSPGAPQHYGNFGVAVALDGDAVLIGANSETTSGVMIGAAHLFTKGRTSWTEQTRLAPIDGLARDGFGAAVALSGEYLLVAAPGRDQYGDQSGEVYVFQDGTLELGDPCRVGSDCPTGFCVDGVCCDSACGGGSTSDCRACRATLTGGRDGVCSLVPAETACGDATDSVCNRADRCSAAGTCEARVVEDGTPCDAGAFCTAGDACRSGLCQEGTLAPCGPAQKCSEERNQCYAACGDGVRDGSEACDDGVLNSDREPDACRSNCRAAHCGDGVVDMREECDVGVANSDVQPDVCRTSCLRAHCGDGVLDSGEGCDDGARNGTGGPCRADCSLSTCGDGTRDPGEGCDDGAQNSRTRPDACRPTCVRARCGDGVRDTVEACDLGPLNSDREPGACRTDCSEARCGDGVVDPGEDCEPSLGGDCSEGCVLVPGLDAGVVPTDAGADAGGNVAVDAGPGRADGGREDAGAADGGHGSEHARSGCQAVPSAATPWPVLFAVAFLVRRRRVGPQDRRG